MHAEARAFFRDGSNGGLPKRRHRAGTRWAVANPSCPARIGRFMHDRGRFETVAPWFHFANNFDQHALRSRPLASQVSWARRYQVITCGQCRTCSFHRTCSRLRSCSLSKDMACRLCPSSPRAASRTWLQEMRAFNFESRGRLPTRSTSRDLSDRRDHNVPHQPVR